MTTTNRSLVTLVSCSLLTLAAVCPGAARAAGPAAPAQKAAAPPGAAAPAAGHAAAAQNKQQEDLKALVNADYASVEDAIRAAMAGPHRKRGNALRGYWRHPFETLTFFGLRKDMTVLELWPGGGWYTEILAPVMYRSGKLKVTNGNPKGAQGTEENSFAKRYNDFLAATPEVYGKVEVVTVDPPTKLDLGPDDSVDMVLTFRNMHNWQQAGYLDQLLASVHKVLKKGGVFGVVDHRARPNAKPEDSAKTGYLPEAWVIKKVTAAGFKLAARSQINSNPKDRKDYKDGVWTLAPTFAAGAKDREKIVAIGESDRMALKFVKQ